ncbi:MAG TPA: xanthine dehydrogenase family protein molybdopterin-binding subunit, partial [Gemmatimonadales bacterium]|nr:xanthine dehydrogenase family protein molybdopterin-binding subunit [Gemmatimonadales bacterium]
MYGVDYLEVGTLYGKLLRSPVPAGFITVLDTTPALRIPGVHAVLTAADAPVARAGAVVRDQPLFAESAVRYEGEPIAGVVADSEGTARLAVDAIILEIEPLPAVGDLEAAAAPDSPLVHPEADRYEYAMDYPHHANIAADVLLDPDPDAVAKAFDEASVVVDGEYRAQRQYQAYLEPKSALARFENGRFIVHTASQFPFNVRNQVAQFLGVRTSDVRVLGHHIGGGFGAKLDASLEIYAALFTRAVRRPVKITNDRGEDMLSCGSRENGLVRIRTALSSGGTILGRDIDVLMDNGAYSGEMPFMASLPMHVFGQVYRAGAARVRCRLVYTNTAPTGAFRGVSGTYLYFALERHMDECALRLGIDRRQFRLNNLIRSGDASLVGQVLEDADILTEAFERLYQHLPWDEATRRPPAAGKLTGVGIAAATWLTNPGPGAVTLKLNEDGTAALVSAATDNGSGAVSMGITQIAAEELGLQPGDISIGMPDTDAAGYDAGSQGSRTTHIVGRAVRLAAAEVREKIFAVAARVLEVDEADLELSRGSVQVRGAPARAISLASVAAEAMWSSGPIMGTGSYATPAPAYNPSCASGLLFPTFPTPTYHVHFAEVEVDPATGAVTVLRYVVVQEVGKAINPVGVRGQIQGGVAQGLGYVLYEGLEIVDSRYLQRTLETYRLPLAVDVPEVEAILLEHGDSAGPFGARGVAEPPIVPVAAAIGNAVADAIGKSINRVPIRPDD